MFWRGVWGYLPAQIVQGVVGFLTIFVFTRLLSADDFGRILDGLINQDPVITAAMIQHLNPSRQKVIVPGAKILEAILDQYHITSIHVSQNGVREGFLIRNVLAEFH